jgi:hypothetical protein
MRITSGGDLLIGKTSQALGSVGHEFDNTGYAYHTRNGAECLYLNRQSTDGAIANFYKDNTIVGRIGAVAGDMVIGTGTAGLRFWDSGPAIQPRNSDGSANNDAIDLGISTSRFKDLYLSGTANISGGSNQITLDTGSQTTYGRLDVGHFSNGAFIGTYAGTDPAANVMRFGTSGTERMRITSAGSVGIGTSSPSSKLHISDANTSIIKASVDAGGSGVGSFRASHGTNEFGFYVAGTNALVFYDYGSNNERMRIDSAGRVGIGTSSPINSLHIQDSINQKMIITNDDFVDGTTGTSFDITFGATSGNTYSEIRHLINGRGAWGNFVLARNGGNVGIGLTVPTEKLHVSGNILATGNITAYSDERLKSDIETLDGSKVYEMRGVSYIKDGQASSGVIAQELQKVAPELVSESGEYLSVAYGNLVGYLIEAVKELKAEIEELKNASSD